MVFEVMAEVAIRPDGSEVEIPCKTKGIRIAQSGKKHEFFNEFGGDGQRGHPATSAQRLKYLITQKVFASKNIEEPLVFEWPKWRYRHICM